MQRIVVRGASGSGKTTLARTLAARLALPHVELDALFHQPNWTPLPDDEFRTAVAAATAGDRWVVDGNYRVVQADLWARADTVVWVDLPRLVTLRRVLWRTVARGALRRPLWNGNRESLRSLLRRDPEDNIVAWSWVTWPQAHRDALAVEAGAHPAHLRAVRLSSSAAVAAFVADLP